MSDDSDVIADGVCMLTASVVHDGARVSAQLYITHIAPLKWMDGRDYYQNGLASLL